ncbi:metallophosphoesterase [Alkalinema sp. FACHB-956]|uniref:metallophosphoesterase n=1 Tax=Alkalinema sp. FACHB-956 TaxID=2692768 RepID=UPI00168249ED|nr:metallophosphoesterase [Alkalinema sp. FACHB-956]MBD2326033.1 metallophosphoesterase [Alkalinema sp. FACHB-956]
MHWLLTGSLKIDRLELPIQNLPIHLDGLKIVQLSDFHWDGLRLSADLLEAAIAASNREVPDLIALTGDFVTHSAQPIHELASYLQQLHSRHGIYAVLGNHDRYHRTSQSEITQSLEKIGIQVLWNQVAYPLGQEFAIVGLAEYWSQEFQPAPVMEALPQEIPRLVLVHNPDAAKNLAPWRVDLQLSGHTHGGQIILPGIGNVSAVVSRHYRQIHWRIKKALPILRSAHRVLKNWDWASGLHAVPNQMGQTNQLYVNRGLGTYLPGRLLCPPELTVITLKADRSRP